MKKTIKTIIFALIGILGMVSCSETDEANYEYANWQSRNDAYFQMCYDSVGTNGWEKYKVLSKNNGSEGVATDYILMKKVADTAAVNAPSPLHSDSVLIHYRGNLMPADTYNDEVNRKNGFQFDSSWFGDYDIKRMVPVKGYVGGYVAGFATALQYMHVGDRCLVVIPYQQGYGTSDNNTIPGGSVLRFDITLVGFSRAGNKLPTL